MGLAAAPSIARGSREFSGDPAPRWANRNTGARRKIMLEIRTVAVFCGSHAGDDPAFRAAAVSLGEGLARSGIRLVYGGGRVGLMGALADAVLAAGGQVIGVIPDFLTRREVRMRGVDGAGRHRQHAHPQAPHVRAGRRLRHPAGRPRDAGRDHRDHHLAAAPAARQADPAMRRRRLGRAAVWPRSRPRSSGASPVPRCGGSTRWLDGVPAVLQRLSHPAPRAAGGEAARL